MKRFLLSFLCLVGMISWAYADDTFVKVTSLSQLSNNCEVIIAGQNSSSWYAIIKGSKGSSNAVSVTVADNAITLASEANVAVYAVENFTVSGSTATCNFKDTSNNKYIGNAANSANLGSVLSIATGYTATIDLSQSKNVITFDNSNSQKYLYLNGSGPFKCYNQSTSYNAPVLFVKQSIGGSAPSAPTFNPNGGEISGSTNVTITSTGATSILYSTTSATGPWTPETPNNGSITVQVSEACTLWAKGTNTYGSSDVSSAIFTVGSDPTPTGDYEDFDFTSNTWNFPTSKTVGPGSYTCNSRTITVAGNTSNGFYWANDYKLLLGKKNAYIQLPAFSRDVEKIEVFYSSESGTSASVNIFANDVAASDASNSVKNGSHEYVIASDKQAAGTIYKVKITNSYNAQFAKIRVYFKEGGPSKPAAPTLSATSANLTVGEAYTVTVTGPEGAKLYYTLNGSAPATDSPYVTSGGTVTIPTDVATTVTLTVKSYKDDQWSESAAVGTYTVTAPPTSAIPIKLTYNNIGTQWEKVYVVVEATYDGNTYSAYNGSLTDNEMTHVEGTNLWTFDGEVELWKEINRTWTKLPVGASVTDIKVVFSNGTKAQQVPASATAYTENMQYNPQAIYAVGNGNFSKNTVQTSNDNGIVTFTFTENPNGLRFQIYGTTSHCFYYGGTSGVTVDANDTWTPVTRAWLSSNPAGVINFTPDYDWSKGVTIYLDLANNQVMAVGTEAAPALETVATPTLNASVTEATVGQTISVTPSCDTEGVTYYYTLNGDTPTTSSTQMTGTSIAVTSDTPRTVTLKVIAAKSGMTNSDVATATYTFTAAPAATGKVYVKVNSTADIVDGATYLIVATNGGNTYANGGYSSNTLAAVAVEASGNTITVPPTAAVEPFTLTKNGTNYSAQLVSDNSKYFHVNSNNLSINTTVTPYINVSVASGVATISDPSKSNRYIFYRPNTTCFRNNASSNSGADYVMPMLYMEVGELSAPVITPASGTELTIVTPVSISCPGASKIFFTIDDSTPTCDASGNATGTTFLYEGPQTLPYEADGYTIKAMGWNAVGTSPVATATYTVAVPAPVIPVEFSPAQGEVALDTEVELTANGATTLLYRTGTSGEWISIPLTGGVVNVKVTINAATTIQAKTINSEGTESPVYTAVYTIPVPQAPLTLSPSGGAVDYGTVVTISCADASHIKYQIDDNEPVTVEGTSASITLNYNGKVVNVKAWPMLNGAAGAMVETSYNVGGAPGVYYQLVNSADDINLNDDYIFVAKYTAKGESEKTYAMGTIAKDYGLAVDVTERVDDGGLIILPPDSQVVPFHFEEAEKPENAAGADQDKQFYELLTADGYIYCAGGTNPNMSVRNDLLTPACVVINGTSHVATVNFGLNTTGAGVTSDGTRVTRTMRFNYNNGNTPRFKPYSNGQTDVYLYRMIYNSNALPPIITVEGKRVGSDIVPLQEGDYTAKSSGTTYHVPVVATVSTRLEGEKVNYSTDGSVWTTDAASPVEVDVNAPMVVYAYTSADGKFNSQTVDHQFNLVPAVPTVATAYNNADNTYTVSFDCITPDVEIQYSLEGGAWTSYSAPFVVSEQGTNTLAFKAVSSAWGNESAEGHYIVTVGNPDPFTLVTNANQLQPGDEIIIVNKNASTLYPGHDENNPVAKFYAMGAYQTGGSFFNGYDLSGKGLAPVEKDGKMQILLSPNQTEVEVFTLEVAQSESGTWYLRGNSAAAADKYLYDPGTVGDNKNNLIVKNVKAGRSTATITITTDGNAVATIRFDNPSEENNVLFYTASNASPRFGAYTVDNAENDRYKIQVYRRGDNHIRVARPTVSLPEGFYTADELAAINASGGVTLSCETEGATIYYTTDGTNPYEFGVPYVADTPIPVSEGTMIAAFADVDNDDTYKKSYELICVYHVFSGNKKYRRVTADEVQTLAPGEEVIVVATNGTKYYALGRHQLLDADTDNTFRAAVELNAGVEDGIVTITQAEVQPIILVSGKYDAYEAFNWRLYTNGSYFNQITDSRHYDGYLYSGGDNASLATMRIEDTEDIYMANADVRFLQYSLAGDALNLHGGVSVQFGSPDGNEERYPNYLSLHHVGEGEWHFDVSRLDDILKPPTGTERYAVSLFRLYDDSQMLQPTFSVPSGRIGDNEKITISSADNGAVIYYSLDGENFTEYNDNEPIVLERSVNGQPRFVWTYAEDAFGVRDNSLVNRQDYIVVGMTIYELVTKVEDIHINDRIIMVNATPFTRDGGRYYAFSNRRNHGDNPYYYGSEIEEAIPQEGRNHLLQLEEGSDIVVFKVEMHQNTEAYANRPYLFNVVNSGTRLEDGLEQGGGYVKTINLKDISIGAALPPTIGERSQYSAHISIADAEDYTSFDTGGEKGIVPAVAKIAFVNDKAGIYNYIRFNAASGSRPHFNAYGTSYDVDNYTFNPDEIVYNASTWPVHIYRALAKVDNPSITAYEAQVDYNNHELDPRKHTYPTVGASGDQEVFHNAVKLVVRQSARTAYGADLLYHWGESKTVHPVTSDYKKFEEANTFTVYLDGYGHYTTVDDDPFSAALMAEIMKYTEATPVIRALAGIEDENGEYVVSRPSLRELHFETTPPILRANNAEGNVVLVSRPHTYTLNATLHYTTNGTLPTADSPVVDPESTITLNSGETLIVGAFKDGYTPTFTTYSAYNHYADPRPMQLLELTPAGEDELGIQAATDGSKHYLTFRTDRNLNFYLVTYNATTGEYSVEDTDNDKARALVGDAGAPTNYKYLWTPMFYVMAYNATDDAFPFDKLDPETELVVKVKDGSRTFPTVAHTVTIASQGDAEKKYYGAVIDRNGIIGQRSMNISLDYQIEGTPYHTEQIVLVTPTMPNPVHGYYRFQYHQYSVADGYPEQNLRRLFPGAEFVKVKVPSSVKGEYIDGVFKPEMCDVLLPIDDVDPRQLDCVIAFYRPNISTDVLRHYDIQYNVEFTNNLEENLRGDGIFADKDVFSASSDGVYAFAIDRIHPRQAVYPILRVLGTEYVQNEEASDAYGSYTADWGYREDGTLGTPNEESPTVTGIEIKAVNHSEIGETSMEKIFISQLTGDMTDFYGRRAKEGKRDWIYNGHTEFKDEGDVIFDPSQADLDHTNDFAVNGELEDGKKIVNARFYHLETYVEAEPGAPAEYASYQYLVQHKEGHLDDVPEWSKGIVADLCQWGDTDPLVGTYIATDFTSDQTPTVKVTPVYLFWRTPEAVEGGDNKTPTSTTTLELIKAIDRTPASTPVVAKRSARANTLDEGEAPAAGNAPKLYAHNLETDMNHPSIADLTPDNRFVVVKTESTAQQAEVPNNKWGGIPTGVEEVAIDALNADAEFFTLQGIRVEHPAPGNVYIVRQGTSTLKVLVK